MNALPFGEMLRFGGYGAYLGFGLSIIILILIVVGLIMAGKPAPGAMKGWRWAMAILGLLAALGASFGTLGGLTKIWSAAQADPVLFGQGSFEILFNVVFNLLAAFLAVLGVVMVDAVARKEK